MRTKHEVSNYTIHPERYRCLRRLLREDDCQYLREAGFAKLAREKRAADRRAFLKMVHHLSVDIRRVADARQQQMERAGTIDLESVLKERFATNFRLQRLRFAAFLHLTRVPAAIQVADAALATLENAFILPTRVLAS